MKILIIHNKYVEKGGEDTTVNNEFSLLKKYENDVELLIFNNNGKFKQIINFLLYPVNLFSYLKIRKKIKEFKPDVIHVHNFFFSCSPMVVWAAKKENTPVILTIQNFRLLCPSGTLFHKGEIYTKSLKDHFTLQPSIDRVYRNSFFLTLWLYTSNYIHFKIGTWGNCAKFIFASNFSKTVFEQSKFRIYSSRFILKYNFLAKEMNDAPVNDERQEYFLFIGRLTEEKGIDVLLNCFKQSSQKLLIVGNGKLKDEVIESSKRNKNIEFLGFKEKAEILHYLSNAKALIFPSIWYEGMPLTIVESFSVGTPVIASNLGAMGEIIIDGLNGLHFEPGNPADLQNKINQLMGLSTTEYKEMLENTYDNFERKFSAEDNYSQLINIYNEVISTGK